MTDLYDDVYALLHGGAWTNYGSEPPMFDSTIINSDAMGAGNYINIIPGENTNENTASNTIIYKMKSGTIMITGTTKANRDNIYLDVKANLASTAVSIDAEQLLNEPDKYVLLLEIMEVTST